MSEQTNYARRRFIGTAAMALVGVQLGRIGSVNPQPGKLTRVDATRIAVTNQTITLNTSFGPLKQIDAGVLNVGYAEAGPPDGPPAILLHGWPYDIHTYVDVAPL